MKKIAGYLTKNRSEKDQKIAQSTHENGYIKPRKTFWRNSKQLLSPDDREAGGSMLSVTGLNHFYYVRDFTDMRCKHSRVLSIIRELLHREPCDGDVFIVMS